MLVSQWPEADCLLADVGAVMIGLRYLWPQKLAAFFRNMEDVLGFIRQDKKNTTSTQLEISLTTKQLQNNNVVV